jgi:hypothetical protein
VEWAPQTPRKWEGDAAARRYKVPKGNSSICPGDETHVFQRVTERELWDFHIQYQSVTHPGAHAPLITIMSLPQDGRSKGT